MLSFIDRPLAAIPLRANPPPAGTPISSRVQVRDKSLQPSRHLTMALLQGDRLSDPQQWSCALQHISAQEGSPVIELISADTDSSQLFKGAMWLAARHRRPVRQVHRWIYRAEWYRVRPPDLAASRSSASGRRFRLLIESDNGCMRFCRWPTRAAAKWRQRCGCCGDVGASPLLFKHLGVAP